MEIKPIEERKELGSGFSLDDSANELGGEEDYNIETKEPKPPQLISQPPEFVEVSGEGVKIGSGVLNAEILTHLTLFLFQQKEVQQFFNKTKNHSGYAG